MKESELIKKMNKISNHLKKTKLVENSIRLAKEYGKGKTEELHFRVKSNYKFDNEKLMVHYSDGWSDFGGGEIKVYFNNSIVLYGDRNSLGKPENKFNPEVDNFCILSYHTGKWEDEIKKEIRLKSKKEKNIKKTKDCFASKININRLKNNFNMLK